MKRVSYKGYLIQAAPKRLVDSGNWTTDISILHDTSGAVSIRQFSAGNEFNSESEAIQHCINFGREIIDGKFEDCTVDDL